MQNAYQRQREAAENVGLGAGFIWGGGRTAGPSSWWLDGLGLAVLDDADFEELVGVDFEAKLDLRSLMRRRWDAVEVELVSLSTSERRRRSTGYRRQCRASGTL